MTPHQEMSAIKLYKSLEQQREHYDCRAEDASLLTIPSLIPKNHDGHGSHDFPQPRQSIGAMGVNSLANKIMMALFPATQSFFRYEASPFYWENLVSDEDRPRVEARLKQREDAIHLEIIRRNIRPRMTEAIKHLVVGGSILLYFGDDRFQFFPLKRHVAQRDADSDEWKYLVTKETVALLSLPEDVMALAKSTDAKHVDHNEIGALNSEDEVDIFTKIWREGNRVKWHQEFSSGAVIPGSESDVPSNLNPWHHVTWNIVEGEDYGRGHVEDGIGDLALLERLMQALGEGSVGAARLVGLVKENGQTMPDDINNAKNGEFVLGNPDDIAFLQVQKNADFRTAEAMAIRIEERLNRHFLVSEVRDAERVTAEEVRLIQRELNANLSGQFANLAQLIQQPLVMTTEAYLERRGDMATIPAEEKKEITPIIVTGVEALGRAADLERLQVAIGAVQQIVGPEQAAQYLNVSAIFQYALTNAGADVPGAVKTEEQLAQEQQQAQLAQAAQTVLERGAGPLVQGAVDAAQPQEAAAAQ